MRHLIDILELSVEELDSLIKTACDIIENPDKYAHKCAGKKLATLFFEPSTRTRLSFEAAMYELGGNVLTMADASSSSAAKGESVADTAKMISCYADIIAMRHPKEGAPLVAANNASIPVINAGDGDRAYPVKTLADISSVWIEKNHISNMKIGFVGDFSNNALVRGLLQCLNIYKGNEFYFISANGKPIPDDFISIMDKRDKPYVVYDNLAEPLPELDVIYFTEVKKESFKSAIQYGARKHCFSLDERLLLTAKPELVILHQFPRGVEIDMSVDSDPRAKYFDALNYNVDAAMAIIQKLISKRKGRLIKPCYEEATHDFKCLKDDCITSTEDYLPPLFHENAEGELVCKYCGQKYEAK